MFNKNIRSYEVSIWTLQDSFITTLKSSNLENKGMIQDAQMNIKDDGTREFTFSIPMYYYVGPNKVENPNWYHTRNGNIIVSMRKIKVIFNKLTDIEQVFEFIITDVTETHDNGELMCSVTCEGLAFHELGKIGYKISLSQEDFLEEWTEWATEVYDTNDPVAVVDHNAREPKNNLNYWADKVLKDTNWSYSIQMDWSGIDGKVIVEMSSEGYPMVNWAIVNRTRVWNGEMFLAKIIPYGTLTEEQRARVNKLREDQGLRRCDRVYEDEYVSSWHEDNGLLTPVTTEPRREKMRLLDEEESNIYNLTQTIAETFGVHCKYVYHYDENYHIIKREVVFYNNFLQETTGEISITYPYSTVKIEREMNSTDLVTKMYVKPLEDTNLLAGSASIMDTSANKSGEDYVLDFDYLYSIGTITEQQYDEVSKYEAKMHELNNQIIPLSGQLIHYQEELIDVQAAKVHAYNAMSLDDERMSACDDELKAITNDTGILTVDERRPDLCVALQEENSNMYYIRIRNKKGLYANSIHLYEDYDASILKLKNEVHSFDVDVDEFGNLTGKITNLKGPDTENNETMKMYYATYTYEPELYYDNIKRIWQIRKQKDEETYNKQAAREITLDGKKDSEGNRITDGQIQVLEKQLQDIYDLKEQIIKAFERMMGPALREGTWQPEDDYANYGDKYSELYNLTNASVFQHQLTSIGWDSELLDSEQKNYYEYSAAQEKRYYPCIDLTNFLSRFTDDAIYNRIKIDNLTVESLCFAFQDLQYGNIENPKFFRYFSIGSQCQLAFIRPIGSNIVKPVLMITGVETLAEDIDITSAAAHGQIGYVKVSVSADGSTITNTIEPIISENEIVWVSKNLLEKYEIVYPRIRIASPNVKYSEDELSLMQNNGVLHNYEDYYVISRSEKDVTLSDYSYIVTIKPNTIVRAGKIENQYRINYSISNTGLLIYLDAIEVMKENAYPKVTYEVEPSIMTPEFIQQAYNTLDKIIWLNDDELKLENVRGYISELDLNLDHPWEDKITITNYKTKFEDLFSNIVAQTEEMKKNSGIIGAAASIFTTTGQLTSSALQGALNRADLNYAFNQGTLTIDEENGIWGTSDDGVVAFRGGGIFTATEKDAEGNWIWNTGILPSGINANLITTGQLDTNLIRIYSGNNLKFQMNGEGLFAYKSWLEDDAISLSARNQRQEQYKNNPLNAGQYVVHNSEGLFLVAKQGALVLNDEGTDYNRIETDINRVAISWDGLTIRNWDNEKVFYADGLGNLTLQGRIEADSGYFHGAVEASEFKIHKEDTDEYVYVDDYVSWLFSVNGSGLHGLWQNIEDNFTDITANVDGISTRIGSAEGKITKLTATVDGISTSINDPVNGLSHQLSVTADSLNSNIRKTEENETSIANLRATIDGFSAEFITESIKTVVDEELRDTNITELTQLTEYMRFINSSAINSATRPNDFGYAYVFPGLYVGKADNGETLYEAAMCTDGYFRVIQTIYSDNNHTDYTKIVTNAFGPTKHQFGTLNLYETSDGGHAFI